MADYDAILEHRMDEPACSADASSRFRITVIHTKREATFSALRFAGKLSRGLECKIDLIAAQAVPYQLSLVDPPVPVAFTVASLNALVANANIDAGEIRIRIFLCRDRRHCLQQVLPPRSLVVLAGKRRWWSAEKKLDRWLSRMGHQVLFVDEGS